VLFKHCGAEPVRKKQLRSPFVEAVPGFIWLLDNSFWDRLVLTVSLSFAIEAGARVTPPVRIR
jgi:hypothetical protein